MTKEAAAIRTAAAANRMPLCMTPPGRRANPDRRITRTGPLPGCTRTIVYAGAAFKNRKGTAKTVLPGVLLDCNAVPDRKSTRLNSSHRTISYAVFCLKKKKRDITGRERRTDAP